MAARKYGGVAEDYLALETWMDFTKSHIADCRHRLFLHNAWGLFVAERIHGATLTRASDGKLLPLRQLLEDHVLQDFGKIPTLAQCLAQLAPEPIAGEVDLTEQCCRAAVRFGGDWSDYQEVGSFLDWPHSYLPDGRYRRILHNGWGVALAVEAFGAAFARASDGALVPTAVVAEAHIQDEYGRRVPLLEECLEGIEVQRWMCTRAMPDPS
ncbi:MAG TPA: hypothetical protein VGS80_26090 [Ktedonobacterales bacterium]|nr:hypothetical protein [Ktedonobacterales bacterium]